MSFRAASSSGGGGGGATSDHQSKSVMNKKKFKGIRRRKWGKWVSEIRVPGTSSRLWLGSYSTAEGAAAAFDVASSYLRSSSSSLGGVVCGGEGFSFPEMVRRAGDGVSLSPRSVQKAASDAGMAVDAAHRVGLRGSEIRRGEMNANREDMWSFGGGSNGGNCKADDLNISVDDYL